MNSPITIGVSACLLGEHVRYDGGHTHDHYITDVLGRVFTFIPVCPEVECGMTTPREAMRLEGDPAAPRLITRHSRIDKTGQMLSYCQRKLQQLEDADLCGFIFKKNSPSSGLWRVKVYGASGRAVKKGSGLFAAAVARHFPLLPMEEEGRLNDPHVRENFIERIFACRRWKDFLRDSPDAGKLVKFHTSHKLLMMAHSQSIYRQMGRLVAHATEMEPADLFIQYQELLMNGLALQATARKNSNVLMHVMGYFKKVLSPQEKTELLESINQYHAQLLPLIVPLTLLRHYVNKYDQSNLQGQIYISPDPHRLLL